MRGPKRTRCAWWGAVVGIALLAGGCSEEWSPFDPSRLANSADPPVGLVHPVLVLQEDEDGWRGQLEFSFRNLTGRRVSLLNCLGTFSVRLDRQVDGEWQGAWAPAMFLCLSAPIDLEPGESVTRTLPVHWWKPGGTFRPQMDPDEVEGLYRLVITSAYVNYDHSGPPWGTEPPLEFRVSEPFEIRTSN